ncbi:hypothetical protein RFI_33894, partial [Reticulomyxa filosa]
KHTEFEFRLQIKNLKDNPQNAAQKLDNKNKVHKRYIAFSNGTAVKEKQMTYLSTYTRSDVILFNNYPIKYSEIISQMKELPINDSEMVKQIRARLRNKQLESYPQHKMDFVDALTYLLFGTEVARNPGCILLHQMMLDLIESKQYTFEMFLDSGSMLMPMAMSGAVHAARMAYVYLEPFLPKSYKYPGPCYHDDTFRQLFEKENHLIELWLKLKQKPEQFTENKKDKKKRLNNQYSYVKMNANGKPFWLFMCELFKKKLFCFVLTIQNLISYIFRTYSSLKTQKRSFNKCENISSNTSLDNSGHKKSFNHFDTYNLTNNIIFIIDDKQDSKSAEQCQRKIFLFVKDNREEIKITKCKMYILTFALFGMCKQFL